jgi:hypothetical protein
MILNKKIVSRGCPILLVVVLIKKKKTINKVRRAKSYE